MPVDNLSPIDIEAGGRLIEAVGTPEFGSELLAAARAISDVDELFGYLVCGDEEPQVLVSSGTLAGLEGRVEDYVHRFFRHDPAVHEIRRIAVGDSFVQRIGIADIVLHDYRRRCFDAPGFTEKLSFGWRGERYVLFISFYRRRAYDDRALYKLASLANLTLAVMARHHAPLNRDNVVDVLERRLKRSFDRLTVRERQICARTLAGHSAAAIGEELGVSAGTVLTYRQRAYQKYGISGAPEFLPAVLN